MCDQARKILDITASPQCLLGWICAIGVLPLLGCGHGGRMSVEGTVTLDDRPLKNGAIQFRPLAGTNGPTAGAEIVDGKFVVPARGGPFAGKFRVEITAVRRSGRKVPNLMGTGMVDEHSQFLPARYNSESQLKAEVTANGPNHFDFGLISENGPIAPEKSTP